MDFHVAALAQFADIFGYTIERFGAAQADVYAVRLAGRLKALASGHGPKARPCERLMRGAREASGLTCFREESYYLILREKPDAIKVVEIFHERMKIEEHLEGLLREDTPPP